MLEKDLVSGKKGAVELSVDRTNVEVWVGRKGWQNLEFCLRLLHSVWSPHCAETKIDKATCCANGYLMCPPIRPHSEKRP